MNVILYINKTSPKLIKIGFVGLKKKFLKKKKDFKDLSFSVTRQNGLFINSCDICNCTISFQFLLKYEEKEKIFLLYRKSIDIKKPKNGLEKINNYNEDENKKYNNENKVNEKIEYEDDKNNDKKEKKGTRE